jgi:uncharacterized membrane protein YeiH
MGMLTATGGGVIRDVMTNQKPMISSGQLYATVALFGDACYCSLSALTKYCPSRWVVCYGRWRSSSTSE